MATEFVWDPKKANANERKHRVTFEEAVTVFIDPLARIHDDLAHSVREPREIIVGHSLQDRLLSCILYPARYDGPNHQRSTGDTT